MKYLFCIALILLLAEKQLFVNAFFYPTTTSYNTQQSYNNLYNTFPTNSLYNTQPTNVLRSTAPSYSVSKPTQTSVKTQALSKASSYDEQDDLPPPQLSLGLFKSLSTLVKKNP